MEKEKPVVLKLNDHFKKWCSEPAKIEYWEEFHKNLNNIKQLYSMK